MNDAQDRRMAFAQRDFDIVLKERGGWPDFHRVMKLPKPVPVAYGSIKFPAGTVVFAEGSEWVAR